MGDATPSGLIPQSPALRMSNRQGVVLIVLAGVLWSLNGPLIKLLHQAGTEAWTIAFYRSAIGGLALTPFACRRPATLRLGRGLIISVLVFTCMTTSFILATTLTQAANAILLQYTAPVWVFALSPWLLGERSARRDRIVLAVALLGVCVIFAGQGATPDLPGLIVGVVSGLFFGLLMIVLRHLRRVEPIVVIWINNIGSALILLPLTITVSSLGVSAYPFALLLLLGVVQFAIPYLLFSSGLRIVPAHRAGLLTLIEPALNPVWTWMVVGETPYLTTIGGGSLILLALVLQIVLHVRGAR